MKKPKKTIVLNLGRGEGKTTAAINLAHETGAYIICLNRMRAFHIFEMSKRMGKLIRFPVTWGEYQRDRMNSSSTKNIIIEDAQDLFQSMFDHLDVEMITMNCIDSRNKKKRVTK